MKRILPALFLSCLAVTLCGCPFESPYYLDEVPQENIDPILIGKWAAMIKKPGNDKYQKEEPVKLIIAQRTDQEYDIAITGYIDELKPYHVIADDSIKGTAYLSSLAGKRFINAFICGRVYIAELVSNSSQVSIFPIAESFTSKYIRNSRELRTALEFHYKMRLRPGYDPLFTLNNLQKVN